MSDARPQARGRRAGLAGLAGLVAFSPSAARCSAVWHWA